MGEYGAMVANGGKYDFPAASGAAWLALQGLAAALNSFLHLCSP